MCSKYIIVASSSSQVITSPEPPLQKNIFAKEEIMANPEVTIAEAEELQPQNLPNDNPFSFGIINYIAYICGKHITPFFSEA